MLKKLIIGPIDWFGYTVLSEHQRKFLSGLLSENVKTQLKNLTKGGKHRAQRQKLQQIKHHLYNLGFIDQGLLDLQTFYNRSEDSHIKRLAAWELALWYANDYSAEGAKQALNYLSVAREGEKDGEQLRRIAIVQAECYDLLGKQTEGKEVIKARLSHEQHADLFFAMANLEQTIKNRLDWFNRVMELYHLTPITFHNGGTTYDDLRTTPTEKAINDGPKVSVILPAYNAEEGISTAIESIQSQTWKNLELLIVDDCSTDRTLDVIHTYAKKDKRIKVFSTPTNSGPYVARNIALKEATGEFVTVNDADDWSHAEKIAIQARHLIENKQVIANTSEHARLTEELKAYRRGTPGKYIFPNMSSLMFRRKPVTEKLGFWDSVRFAADGEFKRRLIKAFGKSSYVDLKSGPLSLPRQSVTSLTASSAFGYNGFFMGARKEYVEAFSYYHETANSLYYPYPQQERLFLVPEPMWPNREEKRSGSRHFDVVIAADFRYEDPLLASEIKKWPTLQQRIGVLQLNQYDLNQNGKIHVNIRQALNDNLQVLVYGETITTERLIIFHPDALKYRQKYIPKVHADNIYVIVKEEVNIDPPLYDEQLLHYFGKKGIWYPWNTTMNFEDMSRKRTSSK